MTSKRIYASILFITLLGIIVFSAEFYQRTNTVTTIPEPPPPSTELTVQKLEPVVAPFVVIDPGHGGVETGDAYGKVTKTIEKDLNLSISLQLANMLKKAGYRVELTRTADTSVYQVRNGEPFDLKKDLERRAEISNQHKVDLFLSIHADYFPSDLNVKGTTTFYFSSSPFGEESKQFAALLVENIANAIGTRNRGAKDEGFRVLRFNERPAVLLEMGFLSNEQDELILTDPSKQEKLVQTIVESIETFMPVQ
jgi:N-acetylmuramoyl-L-alanine amidase